MRTVYLVTPNEEETARFMEYKLLSLPASSGIVFAGVQISPATETDPSVFNIVVGCLREFDEGLMDSIVRVALKEELSRGLQIKVKAFRGLPRTLPKN